MRKNKAGRKATLKADPIYKDVRTILMSGDAERETLLRLFIAKLAESDQRKKPAS